MIATATAPKLLTPDDLLALPGDGAGYELLDGKLEKQIVSTESSRVGGRVYFHLQQCADGAIPGWVFPPETGFACFPGHPNRVRKPDAAFVSLARMPVETYQADGFCTAVPDLVAEVVSPRDLFRKVTRKRDQWLAAGVRVVWVIDPDTRSLYAHPADGTATFLRDTDTLTAPDVLPGFAVPVADLFRRPGQPAPPAPPTV